MDVEKIEELIRVLESSPTEEICVQKGDYKICIKKGARPAPPTTKKVAQPTGVASHTPKAEPHDQAITAPMVGIFHTVEGIAQVGASVHEEQVVGSIESMKLTNDVTSNISGIVKEVLVEDGMPIEYGQPLFRVEIKKV